MQQARYSICHDLLISASVKEIFNAICLPEHLNNWWTLRCSGNPEEGAEYNFYFAEEYDWYGVVSNCEPDQSFYIKMTKADADWNPTSFGFDLAKIDGGVKLQFWHKDWTS